MDSIKTTYDQLSKEQHANLYWADDIKQYCVKINNLVLRGTRGKIYDKKLLLNDRIKAHQVMPCQWGNRCFSILAQDYCKFYHDPLDLLELKNTGKITEVFYQYHISKYTRNFCNTSWLYGKNNNCRDTNIQNIENISFLKKDKKIIDSVELIKQQVMHDILLLLSLSD